MNNKEKDLISIIVPVFNTEKYIQHCLDSIYNQQVEAEIEIIVVNDGSTDGTLNILRNQNHKSLTVISQSNQGPLLARNAG